MSSLQVKILGMGNPLLDISANVGPELLAKYNVKLDSAILAEPQHLPLYEELVQNYSVQYIAGGATQNSMRVAQWMLQRKNQANAVAFMGCVGNDSYAKQLKDCATADGVLVHYQVNETVPTGTCAALIVGGERGLVANLAAANHFTPSHLESPLALQILESIDIYYSAGFFLTVSVDSLVAVASKMAASNKIVALNLSAPFIVDFFDSQLAIALEYADYVFGNESEAAAYGMKHLGSGDDLAVIAQQIASLPKKNPLRSRTVIFTRGSQSTIVATATQVLEFPVTPVTDIVDTNGAGDAFVGGFLSQLLITTNSGADLEASVKAGHWAAAYILKQSGTTLVGPCEYTD